MEKVIEEIKNNLSGIVFTSILLGLFAGVVAGFVLGIMFMEWV